MATASRWQVPRLRYLRDQELVEPVPLLRHISLAILISVSKTSAISLELRPRHETGHKSQLSC